MGGRDEDRNWEESGVLEDEDGKTKGGNRRVGKKNAKEQNREKEKGKEIRNKLEKNRVNNKRKFSKKITSSGYKYFCKQCPFKTVVRFWAKRHSYLLCGDDKKLQQKRKKKIKRRICAMCGMVFTKASEFNKHHRSMHVKKLPCSYCGKLLKSQEVYNKHLVTFHNNNPKNHKCNLCDYKSYRKYNVKVHMRAKHEAETAERPEVRGWVEELPARMEDLLSVPKIRMLSNNVLLLNISPRNVHLVQLAGDKYRRLMSFTTSFDITVIEVHPDFPTLVAVAGKDDIVVYSIESSSNPLQMGLMVVSSSLIPSQPFKLCWIPQAQEMALVAGNGVTILLTSPDCGLRSLGQYSVLDNLAVADVTFCSLTVNTNIFILTKCGSLFFGEATVEGGSSSVLTQQLDVSCCKY